MNFWQKQKKPILALAPMAGVADSAFRQICKDYGADVLYSEMASATALSFQPEKTLELIKADKKEKPYVVQLFGNDPEHFAKAARLLTELNDDDYQGIDINFGCPVPKVAKQKAGAELFRDKNRSKAVIRAVIENTDLPVSIKTRIRAGETELPDFLDSVSDLDIAALMIHGRSLKQGFSGEIDYGIIQEAGNYFGGIILANGGINDLGQAIITLEKTKADGLGLARGVLGKPWLFEEIKTRKKIDKTSREIFEIAINHAALAQSLKGEAGIREMRKHLCWYVAGLKGARQMRGQLVEVKTLDDVRAVFMKYETTSLPLLRGDIEGFTYN